MALLAGAICGVRNDSCSRKHKYARTSHALSSESLSRGVDLFFAQEFCFFKQEHGPPRGSKQAKTDVLLTTVLSPLRRRLPIHTQIIWHDATHTLVEITWPVGTPPGHRPDKTQSARSLRRIPVMTVHQEQRSLSNDGRMQLVRGALRLHAAVIARRPRPIISRCVDLNPRVQPTTGGLEWPQKRPQRLPLTRPLTNAHAGGAGESDGQIGDTAWTSPTTAELQSCSP